MACPPPLRILCLHDEGSNAALLKEELDLLGQRLYAKHGGIDLVYVNSPITVPTPVKQEPNDVLRVWFEKEYNTNDAAICNDANYADADADAKNEQAMVPSYLGLDASLLLLQQIWTSSPFWGILGVGQGAAVASLLTLVLPAMNEERSSSLMTAPPVIPPPSFAIFLAGQTVLPEREKLVVDGFPCLHLVPPTATYTASTNTKQTPLCDKNKNSPSEPPHELLVSQFGGTVHEINTKRRDKNDASSFFTKDALNVMGRFICQQRKQLLSSHSDQEIVVLQTALHLTEQEAADKIAQHIAKNPPAALMAVIRPNAVAGWSGNKRRQPGEEGGGAPCPSEFLLKREKRSDKNKDSQGGSASRMHPQQAKENEP